MHMPMKPPVFRPPGWQPERQRKAAYERLRQQRDPWRAWYRTDRWMQMRAEVLDRYPSCQRCRQAPSTVVHHVTPHRGDAILFWHGALQAVCASCHSGDIQHEEAKDRGGE
jgi:5-methylcytosine-specific restriction enzyme A